MLDRAYQIAINLLLTILMTCLFSSVAGAQKPSAEDVNKANNPLTPAITVNFQESGTTSALRSGWMVECVSAARRTAV
jgi:hypothetical protein